MSKLTQVLVVTVVLTLVGSMAMAAADASSKPTLPAAVDKAFKDTFPKGEVTKFEQEKQSGVSVYAIEFKVGDKEHETDISADGTVMTKEVVVKEPKDVVMKAITAAADGGTVKQIMKITTLCEAKDGKVVKLDKQTTTYEADLVKGDQVAQVTVDDQGKVVEAPKWTKAKATK